MHQASQIADLEAGICANALYHWMEITQPCAQHSAEYFICIVSFSCHFRTMSITVVLPAVKWEAPAWEASPTCVWSHRCLVIEKWSEYRQCDSETHNLWHSLHVTRTLADCVGTQSFWNWEKRWLVSPSQRFPLVHWVPSRSS